MNKKLITAISAVVLSLPITLINTEAKADTQAPAIAILDTALDTSLPILKDRLVYEVCILEWTSCPNGKSFMEGPGSTVLSSDMIFKGGFDHGTQMASIVAQENPNIKIVFVRIIGNTPNGSRQLAYEKTIYQALDWVIANKDRFNIKAVTMSQGHHVLLSNSNYCPSGVNIQNRLNQLISLNIPTFFAAGNGRDYARIDWPACLPESISVGATDQYEEIATYSNFDSKLLDIYAVGNKPVIIPGNYPRYAAGTSVATQVAAVKWIEIAQAKPTLKYSELLTLVTNTAKPVKNFRLTGGKLISVQGALNVK